jgi:hypothetical protein
MGKHLTTCIPMHIEKSKDKKAKPFFHVVVKSPYTSLYWMHLKVSADADLGDLDSFLRDIWLECCGHMSAFSIEDEELDMDEIVEDIFKPGLKIRHEYDFGSTTELLISVIGEYKGPVKEKIELLARNEPPQILCNECGKVPAVEICTECSWSGKGWLCKSCAKKHKCGEDMMLPVVNSPRTGVCGYTG